MGKTATQPASGLGLLHNDRIKGWFCAEGLGAAQVAYERCREFYPYLGACSWASTVSAQSDFLTGARVRCSVSFASDGAILFPFFFFANYVCRRRSVGQATISGIEDSGNADRDGAWKAKDGGDRRD